MKSIKYFLFLLIILGIVGWGSFSIVHNIEKNRGSQKMSDQKTDSVTQKFSAALQKINAKKQWINYEISVIDSQANNINPSVLRLGLQAYLKARGEGLDDKQILTIIDYHKPSTERRLWVVDLKTGKVLFNTWVTHGKNSGQVKATSFSNQPGSLKSSVGVFLTTDEPYFGHNGYSLRLKGLEPGINDNAYRRAIVFHGAWYAGPSIIREYGELGRSWGCPAVSESLARPLINTIKDHTLVFVYSGERRWLSNSAYLTG